MLENKGVENVPSGHKDGKAAVVAIGFKRVYRDNKVGVDALHFEPVSYKFAEFNYDFEGILIYSILHDGADPGKLVISALKGECATLFWNDINIIDLGQVINVYPFHRGPIAVWLVTT